MIKETLGQPLSIRVCQDEGKKSYMKTNRTLTREELAGAHHSVLELPEVEPWPEPVSGAALLDELEGVLRRFVVLPKWAAETLALWVLHTYAFPLRDVSTYLGLESPEKRCGKTTLLTVLSELVNRPVVAANISSSALFRVIEETRPTLLIDEADTLLQGNDELRGILNSGYTRKTAYVVRVASQLTHFSLPGHAAGTRPARQKEGAGVFARRTDGTEAGDSLPGAEALVVSQGATRLVRYSCWCPKVMAARPGTKYQVPSTKYPVPSTESARNLVLGTRNLVLTTAPPSAFPARWAAPSIAASA